MMSSERRSCLNHPDVFCYICGEYTLVKQRKDITDFVKQVYLAYFGVKLGDQDKPWAPHKVCKKCVEDLRHWKNGKKKSLKFGVPMVWREPRDHNEDSCYFCAVNIQGLNKQKKRKCEYPDLETARRPVPHCEEVPIPVFSELPDLSVSEDEYDGYISEDEYDGSTTEPQLFSQGELNDLIRDLNLSKQESEVLASRLKEKNCLKPGVNISHYRKREDGLLPYFTQEEDLVYCCDIPGLLAEMGHPQYQPQDWRLFIDSSKRSLKCVLLHNGNEFASLPLAHSTKMKEEYNSIKMILKKLGYSEHQWSICVDIKMVNFLLGQQHGYTKYSCFICLWDSRAKESHWKKEAWPTRETMTVGTANIINEPLVEREKIILPPLHIKLGLMKQLIKALNREGDCFKYICKTFTGLSMEKIKAGIFNGPQIRKLINDPNFTKSMNRVEASAWNSFVSVVKNFLGNHKAENFKELVNNMLENFKKIGANMSIKVHFLHDHLDRFPNNLGDYSDEQGERFHQEIKVMEERYQGRWDRHMLADYCWSLQRDCQHQSHKRKSYRQCFSK